jgi:integrase
MPVQPYGLQSGFDTQIGENSLRVCEAEPVVLAKEETQRVFEKLEQAEGRYGLPARLQYGAGLRWSELVRLRIKDASPTSLRYAVASLGRVTVRCGKGATASLSYAGASSKDRMTVLPRSLREDIAKQMERARELWSRDRQPEVVSSVLMR